jgi:hypothetical protein
VAARGACTATTIAGDRVSSLRIASSGSGTYLAAFLLALAEPGYVENKKVAIKRGRCPQ